jgi:RHS repeat-associated protein
MGGSRSFQSSTGYRYGFNGKENDNEVKNIDGSQQDYGMRIYDPRLGRFLSVDPLSKEYPWNSTYAFAENDVIRSIDLDGLEKNFRFYVEDKKGNYTMVKEVKWSEVFPGTDHGPKGVGTQDYVYKSKVKKFGAGQYHQTFSEAHPLKAFFGSEYNGRWDDKKGVKQLGKDIKDVGEALGTTSGQVKGVAVVGVLAGSVFGQPEVVAGSVLLYEWGATLENVSTGMQVAGDAVNQNGTGVLNNAAKYVAGKAVGGAIGGTKMSEGSKAVVDYVTGKGVDAVAPEEKKEDSNKSPKLEGN